MDGFRKGRVVLRRCGEIIFGMLGCRAEKEGVYGYMESWKACAVLGRCAGGGGGGYGTCMGCECMNFEKRVGVGVGKRANTHKAYGYR